MRGLRSFMNIRLQRMVERIFQLCFWYHSELVSSSSLYSKIERYCDNHIPLFCCLSRRPIISPRIFFSWVNPLCSMTVMTISWPLSESFVKRLPSGLVIMSLATSFDCYDPSSEKHSFSCTLYHDKRQSVFSFVSHNVMFWQLHPNHGGHKPPLHRRTLPSNGFYGKLQNDAGPFPAADIWCCHSQMCSVWYSDRLGQEPVQCEDTFFLSFQNGCCQAVKSAITAQIKSNRSLLNQVLCNDIQPFLYFLTLQNLCMAEKGHDHVASSLSRPSSYRFRAFFVP